MAFDTTPKTPYLNNMRLFKPINLMMLASIGLHLYVGHVFDPGMDQEPVRLDTSDKDIIELIPLHDIKPEESKPRGQVVELPPGSETEAPEKYDFLAERNMRVALQSAAPLDRKNSRVPAPPSMIMEIEETKSDEDVTVVNTRTLFPSYSDLKEWLDDEPGRIDHLEDVPYGEITQVNARSYKYALFFNQLKRTLYFYWNPVSALALSGNPGRNLETRVRVMIEGNGVLESIEIVKSSGYPRVDLAAAEAFERTAPIYNIPEGLLDEDGRLDMIWSFVIIY